MPIIRVLEHGPVTIPKKFRDILGLEKGDLAEAELEGERIVITPKKQVEDNFKNLWNCLTEYMNETKDSVRRKLLLMY